jgi:hypothetical protein
MLDISGSQVRLWIDAGQIHKLYPVHKNIVRSIKCGSSVIAHYLSIHAKTDAVRS